MSTFTTTPSSSPPAQSDLTRAQLRALVRQNLGGRTDKDALINDALNAGLRNATQRHRFRHRTQEHVLTLLADSDTVALPTTRAQVVEVRVIDGQSSVHVDLTDRVSVLRKVPYVDALTTNRPVAVYEDNGVLRFVPKADKDYEIRVTLLYPADDMVADTDKPGVVGLENALVAYATAHVLRSLEKFSEAERWDVQYERELQAAVVADRRRPALRYMMERHPPAEGVPFLEAYGSAFAGFFGRRRRW